MPSKYGQKSTKHEVKEAKEAKKKVEKSMNFAKKIQEIPDLIKKDARALKIWIEILDNYDQADFQIFSAVDTWLLQNFCMGQSRLEQLHLRRLNGECGKELISEINRLEANQFKLGNQYYLTPSSRLQKAPNLKTIEELKKPEEPKVMDISERLFGVKRSD